MNIRILSACSLAAALSVSASHSAVAATTEAKPIATVAPSYSPELRTRDVEGEVVLAFTISAKGDVSNVEVVSSTDRKLEFPALDAVRRWKFAPAMKDGVAVSVRAVQPVAFQLTELHPQMVASNSRANSLDRTPMAAN
jgi:protein TonB